MMNQNPYPREQQSRQPQRWNPDFDYPFGDPRRENPPSQYPKDWSEAYLRTSKAAVQSYVSTRDNTNQLELTVKELQQQLVAMQKTITRQQNDLQVANKTITELSDSGRETKKAVTDLQYELMKSKATCKRQSNDIESMKAQFEQKLEASKLIYDDKLEGLLSKNQSMEKRIAAMENESRTGLNKRVRDLATLTKRQASRIETFESKISNLEQTHGAQICKLESNTLNLAATTQKQTKYIKSLRNKMDDIDTYIECHEESIDELENSSRAVQSKVEYLGTQRESYNKSINNLGIKLLSRLSDFEKVTYNKLDKQKEELDNKLDLQSMEIEEQLDSFECRLEGLEDRQVECIDFSTERNNLLFQKALLPIATE